MNITELTALLGRIQVLDNRQVDEMTLQAWEPLVEKIDYEDAVAAVNEHFKTSDKYLLPVHVVEGAKRFRAHRVTTRSRIAARRIVELGGKAPSYWNDAPQATEELAALGKRIEMRDPTADDSVRHLVAEQKRVAAEIEAGHAWIDQNRDQVRSS